VINETIKPEESPRIMKAIPVQASPKPRPHMRNHIPLRRQTATSGGKAGTATFKKLNKMANND